MHTSRPRWSVLTALAFSLACTDPTGPGDSDTIPIAIGETVTLDLSTSDTALHLVFQGAADSVYAATVVPVSGGIYVTAFDQVTGAPISTTTVISTITPVAERTTPSFLVPATGSYVIRIYRTGVGVPASATLTLHAVQAGPEQESGTVVVGTPVIGEDLHDLSDLDRFTFTGVAGTWIEPELRVGGVIDLTRTACLTLLAPDGTWLQSTAAFPGDTVVLAPQGGRIQLPSSGTYRVEVASARNRCIGFTNFPYTGSYEFTIHPIDPLPEVAAATVNIGDTVTSEAIDRVGDFDRFRLVGTPGALVMIYPHRHLTGPGGLLRFRAEGQPGYLGEDTYMGSASDTGLTSTPRDVYAIPDSGVLTIRISGWNDGPGGDTGAYRLFFDPIDPAPEVHAAIISIGDTVSDESVDKLGDVDRFTFSGTPGQVANVAFRATSPSGVGALRLMVFGPNGMLQGDVIYRSPGQADAFIGSFTVTSAGMYTMEVTSAHTHLHENVGSYRIAVLEVAPAP